jgi:hypothetical protein
MKRLIDNIAWILPVLVMVGVLLYSFWWRERPQAEGRITGDYAAASAIAAEKGVPLLVAVDAAPH